VLVRWLLRLLAPGVEEDVSAFSRGPAGRVDASGSTNVLNERNSNMILA
jgi:hypothetical protein